MPEAALALLIFAPLVITYVLKSNAALGYLALCVGFVLSTSVVGDLKHLLSETNLSLASDTLALCLLILPYVLTLLAGRKSHEKGLLFYANLLAALLGGGLLALSAGPLISSETNFNVLDSNTWSRLESYQSVIIGAGATLSLLLVWLPARRKKH